MNGTLVMTLVGGLALAAYLSVAAILGISDDLRVDVLSALKPVQTSAVLGMHIVIVDGSPDGVARGMQFGLLALLLGGVPIAIVGRVLAARWTSSDTPLSEDWRGVFLAGLIFQLNSVGLAVFLLVLLLWAMYDAVAYAEDVLWYGGALLAIAASGVWGLPAWRRLQGAAKPAATSIAAF
jgi:hypothetical protein